MCCLVWTLMKFDIKSLYTAVFIIDIGLISFVVSSSCW